MRRQKVTAPEPVIVRTKCRLCSEPWIEHPVNPTALDCIAVLRERITGLESEVQNVKASARLSAARR